jgi:minor extracellular serine protease Vpr
MLSSARYPLAGALLLLTPLALPAPARAMNVARSEARVDSAVTFFGVTGKGVLLAILDRGIDWRSDDFRTLDGKTRIQGILDLTDSTGKAAPNNPYHVGTLYTRGQIDSANAGLAPALATRDAEGHGTTTAGIACGSGRHSPQQKYRGVAPDADLLIVKITSDGVPAHDSQTAEAAFYDPSLIPVAITYAKDMASALHEPCVMVLNIGSIGGPTDGTSQLDRTIDASFGSGIPGLVLVNGTGDDGSSANHAAGALSGGATFTLPFHKGASGPLTFDLWYDGDTGKSFDVDIVSPTFDYGPYYAPPTNDDYDIQNTPEFTYYHYGANVTPWNATNGRREIYLSIFGGTGDYQIHLTNTSGSSAFYDATINPSNIESPYDQNDFTDFIHPGNIGDLASCFHTIIPTDYSVRTSWTDIDGFSRSLNEGVVGDIWKGSSAGPTFDNRLGVDLALPANSVFTTYNPTSYWATFRFNLIQDGGGLYGRASAVSAANPFLGGIIALMLQKNPSLDAVQVRDILRQTARVDSYTGTTPNTIWGYGKVDAMAAMRRVLVTTGDAPPTRTPDRLELSVSGPTPFHGATTLEYSLPRPSSMRLDIIDVTGRRVARLANGWEDAGTRQVVWQAGPAAPGLYFARLTTPQGLATLRLLLLR